VSQPRKPRGIPTGGQFDRKLGGGPATSLEYNEVDVKRRNRMIQEWAAAQHLSRPWRYDRDLGYSHNVKSVHDLVELSDTAEEITSHSFAAFSESTILQHAAKSVLHEYATIVTEHLPGWWRNAHPWLDVENVRSIRNQMHDYPTIEEHDLFETVSSLPDEIAKFDLDVLLVED